MAAVYSFPLRTGCAGVFNVQFNGIAAPGDSYPAGDGRSITFSGGWANLLLDESDAEIYSGQRTEFEFAKEPTGTVTRVYRWTQVFDGWPTSGPFFVVAQVHATHDAHNWREPVLIYFDGSWMWAETPAVEPPLQTDSARAWAGMPAASGVEYQHLLAVKHARDGSGSILWVVNGRQILNLTRIGTAYADALGPYLKLGMYQNVDGLRGYGSRRMRVRDVVVTDALDGSWSTIAGGAPRGRAMAVQR